MEKKTERPFVIPKGQVRRESVYNGKRELVEVVTSDQHYEKWYLYRTDFKEQKLINVATGNSPAEFKDKRYKNENN